MSKIACRKCPKCGKFSDVSVNKCECGSDISQEFAYPVEPDELDSGVVGRINRNLVFYYQKCKNCGSIIFTDDKANRATICLNCNSKSISKDPILYTEVEANTDSDKKPKSAAESKIIIPSRDSAEKQKSSESSLSPEEYKEETENWAVTFSQLFEKAAERGVSKERIDEIFRDLLDEKSIPKSQKAPEKTVVHRVVLSAVRYGKYEIAFDAKPDCSYVLGRSANGAEYLANDLRVGNNHCILRFDNDSWWVIDNHSSNGTFVNNGDIGYNGQCVLHNGDLLKLGHDADSAEFRVTIE
ncbi:MAG: FHA domain-containing protein [Oscillospiraceae bacterium]